MSEFDAGYSVVIGKPVVHAEKKATGSSVSFPCEAIPDGSYLVSLEVNGSVKAYRESMDFSSGSCTVGAYTLSYSSYALTVSGTSNNDIVRVMVEPLDVKTTDAFRAAVKTGALEWAEGGVLVVNVSFTYDDVEETWSFTTDKTFAEIVAADTAGQKILAYCEESVNARVGTPSWLNVSHEDDDTFVLGTTDIPAGSTGQYDELTFYMGADEQTVEVYTWIKKQPTIGE